MSKELIPKIRFKGYTEAWEQRKLGDISTFKQGNQVDLDKQYNDFNNERIRFIRIVDYTQNTDDIRYIDKNLTNNVIDKKDVIIVRYGATAGFVGRGITGVLANNMFTVNPDKSLTREYLYTYLKQEKIYKKLNNSNGSSAMPALNFGTVKALEIVYPNNVEQLKIEVLFNNIDNLITLHQRKYDKLLELKKSLLEKMFPKNNQIYPEIRFNGYAEAWEQRKLLEVADYRNGKAHENDIDPNGKYIVVNSKFVSTEGEIIKYSTYRNEPIEENEIAFVLSDVPNGKAIAKTYLIEKSGKYTLNQRIAGIKPHDDINPKYLSITMNRNKYFLKFDDGVKQTNLSLKDVLKYENLYPSKLEQDKIGSVFENIDNLITLHQRKRFTNYLM